jgi:hypothetical protein
MRIALAALLLAAHAALAQAPAAVPTPPPAKIDHFAWLTGYWRECSDQLLVNLTMRVKDGTTRTDVLRFRKRAS